MISNVGTLMGPAKASGGSGPVPFTLIAVPDGTGLRLMFFNIGDDGVVSPVRSISGASTTFTSPKMPAALGAKIFLVSTFAAIAAFNKTASGNIAPNQGLGGGNTGFSIIRTIASDAVNNQLFAINFGASPDIFVFPSTADGDVAPLRTITSTIDLGGDCFSLGIDTVNNELFVCSNDQGIVVFPLNASGSTAPIRQIKGSNTTFFTGIFGMAVDNVHNEIYISTTGKILVFNRTDNGDIAPKRTIVSSEIKTCYGNLGLNLVEDTLVLPSTTFDSNSSILTFNRTDSGSSLPLRKIQSGPMNAPYGLTLF